MLALKPLYNRIQQGIELAQSGVIPIFGMFRILCAVSSSDSSLACSAESVLSPGMFCSFS
jgi:hypothetical protein